MEDGLITTRSAHSVRDTVDRLTDAATAGGMTIFARVDHAAGAADVGMDLRPTELLIFGHPRGGTPLMIDNQTAGLDLPIRALAWEDEHGHAWLTYNDPAWIAERHRLGPASAAAVQAMTNGLASLSARATGSD